MTRSSRTRALVWPTLIGLVALVACSDSSGAPDVGTGVSASSTTSTSPDEAPTTEGAGTTPSTLTPSSTAPPTTEADGTTITGPAQLAAFAAYTDVPDLDGSTAYAGPPTPRSLDDVQMLDWVREQISQPAGLADAIAANGFAIDGASGYRFFHQIYEAASYEYETVFVTTDSMFNAWHNAFSKILRDTETELLAPALETFLVQAVTAARAQSDELAGTALADAANRVVAFYEAAAVLLGLDVDNVSDRAMAEVRLAEDAAKATTSPITGFQECQLPEAFTGCVDYTQFLPRGHYTSNPVLQRYFRAMSELGQQAFYLSDPASLRLGLLASRIVTADANLSRLWQSIYDTTAFFVGVADDYTPVEADAAATAATGAHLVDTAAYAGDDAVASIRDALLASRAVGIDPENTSVRVMGARLVLDSFILDQLSWPNVGTPAMPRTHVSPLDLASVFGSELATQLQTDAGETQFAHYTEQLDAMRTVVASRDGDQWAGTIYDAWLHALAPQFGERTAAYPDFMRTPAWGAKALQTGFGSYTELKHDTLLYAKQGTAGEGEGPEPPPYEPRHWVEPDPVTFGRLAAMSRLTKDGLAARGLLTDANAALLDSYDELATWLQGVAAAELSGEAVSDADNDRLGTFGSELELLWFQSSDLPPGAIPEFTDNAALVSDIFRSSDEYLELADGLPEEMDVIVPDGHGGFQLAVGATYSYHEFWRPVSLPRLTDEEWRESVDSSTTPPRPAWLAPILIGPAIADGPVVRQEG